MNRSPFKLSGPERRYAQALNGLANHIEALLAGGDPVTSIIQLDQYASAIDRWATVTAQMMIDDVNARNRQFWRQQSEQIGRGLAIELANTDIGQAVQDELRLQVNLIKSLPRQAALQVHELALGAMTDGQRAAGLVDSIIALGSKTRSRAMLIARTEVGRVSGEMTKARAMTAGSDGYIWRSAEDRDVRPSHKKMNGRFVKWNEPPTLDNLTGHAGCLPNCRCYIEPVIPD